MPIEMVSAWALAAAAVAISAVTVATVFTEVFFWVVCVFTGLGTFVNGCNSRYPRRHVASQLVCCSAVGKGIVKQKARDAVFLFFDRFLKHAALQRRLGGSVHDV